MVCLYCTRTAWEGFSLLQQQPNTSLAVLASVGIILKKQQSNPLSWRVTSNGIIRYWAPSSCQRSQGIRGCSALFTQCSYTHLEWMLLSVLLPGLNKPRNGSDLAEEFHKGTQMPRSCCLQALQLSLRKLGGGGVPRKPLSSLQSVLEDAMCSGNDAAQDTNPPGAAWRCGIYYILLLTRLCVVHTVKGDDFVILTSQAYQHMFY